MAQETYEKLLLQRGHAKRRWENQPAEGLTLKDLDRKEILRTRNLAIQQNRISIDTGRNLGEILDRLGLRREGVLLQAAQVLYGKNLLADYPQCQLKLGRFRGTEVTGEIVEQSARTLERLCDGPRRDGISGADFAAGRAGFPKVKSFGRIVFRFRSLPCGKSC